jgi:heme-degrading monooxygenase HmoA
VIAVIFEVHPNEGQMDSYLQMAANLRPALDLTEGFVSMERFRSLTDAGKLLSLSFFKDEEAVRRWRQTDVHRAAQCAGRNHVFADYRLRVAEVGRDYSMLDRLGAPPDLLAHHRCHRSSNSLGERA